MKITGILNVTSDSFSDGGNFVDPEKALNEIYRMIESGIQVLDIGAQATNPKVKSLIDSKKELEYLYPVFAVIYPVIQENNIEISLDTIHADTVENIMSEYHIDIINDQSSGMDDGMLDHIKNNKHLKYVIMHHLTLPANRNIILNSDDNPVKQIEVYLQEKLEYLDCYGIENDRVVLDPGIGFGKDAKMCVHILANLDSLMHKFSNKFMLGHSRKSFLQAIVPNLEAKERDLETAIISSMLYKYHDNIEYLRVHNVEYTNRAFNLIKFLEQYNDWDASLA